MTRVYLALATIGILGFWWYREVKAAEERGALKVQLASVDSSRQRFQDSLKAYQASQKRDSALIASLTAQKEGLVTEAARRGADAATRLRGASATILALRGSLDSLSRLKLDTIQAALDSVMAYAVSEKAARVLGDSLNGILTFRLARAERLLFASDSLVQRQAVLLKTLAPKKPFPLGVGCSGPVIVGTSGYGWGIGCGVSIRF